MQRVLILGSCRTKKTTHSLLEARQRAGGFHEFTVTGEEGIGPPFTNNDFQGATLLRGGRKNANSNVQQRALGEKVRIS